MVLHTFRVGREVPVNLQIRTPDQITELRPKPVIADGQIEIPVACLERFVWHDGWMLVAFARWRLARAEIDAGLVGEKRDLSVEQRDVHLLAASRALARLKRQQNAKRRVNARRDVGQ